MAEAPNTKKQGSLVSSSRPIDTLVYESFKTLNIKYPRFASEIGEANFYYNSNLKYKTACTDGKDIFIDPDYFKGLDPDTRVSVLAHEMAHKRLKHMFRLEDARTGKRRDPQVWNWVTDAIINEELKKDGLPIPDNWIQFPGATKYSAEELYDMVPVLQIAIPTQHQDGDGNSKGQSQGDMGDHSGWGEVFEDFKNKCDKKCNPQEEQPDKGKDKEDEKNANGDKEEEEKKNKESNPQNNQNNQNPSNEQNIDDRKEFEENRNERAKKAQENYEDLKNNALKNSQKRIVSVDKSPVKPILDWKVVLRRRLDKEEYRYTQRKSVAENNWAYRLLEDFEEEDSETEVMLDTSGSIDVQMLRGFLHQLKPLLRESKLKVACFDHTVTDFVELKNDRDIEKYIPVGGGGTNFNLACSKFTRKPNINHIVFTDGDLGTMPTEDKKKIPNLFWIVFENHGFSPGCGEVIPVSDVALKNMNIMGKVMQNALNIDGKDKEI